MTEKKNTIPLLISNASEFAQSSTPDRMGGETHSMKEVILKKVSQLDVDADEFKKNIEDTMHKVADALKDVSQSVSDNWQLTGISVGLSISAEGSIGIATAGVETSIEISFTPK